MNNEQAVNYYLLDTLIGSLVTAVRNIPAHILEAATADHDPKRARVTASFANINTMLVMMGNARENILTFVMPSAVFADLVGNSIANYQFDRIAGVTVYQDVVQAFGRAVIVADVHSLMIPAEGDGYNRYGVLGLGGGSLLEPLADNSTDHRNTTIVLGIFHSVSGIA